MAFVVYIFMCTHRESNMHNCYQLYSLIVNVSKVYGVIYWYFSSLEYVRKLSKFPVPSLAVNEIKMTSEVVTTAGVVHVVCGINCDCLAKYFIMTLIFCHLQWNMWGYFNGITFMPFGIKKMDWVKYSYSPRYIYSLKVFIAEFLKHWCPRFQSFEDTYEAILATL